MRVLVTGGAGFIGSWTVDALATAGHDVLVYDSFVTGRPANLRNDRHDRHNVQLVRGDVRHGLALHRAVRRFQPDSIIHLAARVSVPFSWRQALRSHDDNTRGTVAVLEAARGAHTRRVVLASSAAVYGRNDNLPLREDATLEPLSPYALHKRIGEDYARLYAEIYGLETVALRYFNVFGPRQDPASPYSGVIARFLDACYAGRSVTITGDGAQTRDFVFVGDVARVNVAALSADVSGHLVCNVATGVETSVLQLCADIAAAAGRPLAFDFGDPRPGDIYRSCADVSRLRHALQVRCETTLRRGLRSLVETRGRSGYAT